MGYGASLRKSAANGKPQKVKAGNKNPDQSLQYYLSRMEHDAAKIAAIQAARIPATEQATRVAARTEEDAEDEDPSTHDVGDQRVVIKFFYDELGRPNERHWQGRYGTISRIRTRIGLSCAPDMPTVRRTLLRLKNGDEDVAVKPKCGGEAPAMSTDEDVLVGLLACRGLSQTMALMYLNIQRYENGLEPVTRSTLQRAEDRVRVIRRKRRSQKSGSVEPDSAWAIASLKQSTQLSAQFEAGAAREGEAAPPPPPVVVAMDGPTLVVDGVRVRTCATDPYGALGHTVVISNSVWGKTWTGTSQMRLEGYTPDYKGAPSYFLEPVAATYSGELYAFPPSDVYSLLPDAFVAALEAAEEAEEEVFDEDETDVGPPPSFVPEQGFWLDEHHEQCKLGKASVWDCMLPRDADGNVDIENGTYGDWSDATRVKFPKEVRFLLGVAMVRDEEGVLQGRRMEQPFEYTGKWVVGFKAYEKALRAEIHRANDLKGEGEWSATKEYTKEQLAVLPGGRYQAWRIEMEQDGDTAWRDNWREDVMASVGRGAGACICIKELIDAAITEGNKIFKETKFANSWWLCHDALSAWWEKEARDYIASRGFKDRQLRAWGGVNKDTRYYHSLVGNRPEMCPLDAHLFADLKTAVNKHVVMTCGLRVDDPLRFKMGTPKELAQTLVRTWAVSPEGWRIVQDISRIPSTVAKIIEHGGCTVPDAVLRHGRREPRAKRPPAAALHPDAVTAAAELVSELDSEIAQVKRARA